MNTYAALIRGIGPGDPRKSNEKLRGVLEGLGFSDVRSVISSGNIVFTASETDPRKVEDMIEAAWPKELGFEATTIVRTQAQLQKLLDTDFFDGVAHGKGSYLLLTFFKRPAKPDFDIPYKPADKPYEIVGLTDNVLFTVTDNTAMKTTDLMAWFERQFGKEITSRTPLTIERIIKKMGNK